MQKIKTSFAFLVVILGTIISCTNPSDYSPKPRGFFRISFPEKTYQEAKTGCPFTMDIPSYSVLRDDLTAGAQPCWKNLDFPDYNARLHISYFKISPQAPFSALTEDARTFAFKHTAKASAIDQRRISRPEDAVYGLTYYIKGNTASNLQFFVSDSTKHYLRAALYFNEKPNMDSIAPVLEFIQADVERMVHTITWK